MMRQKHGPNGSAEKHVKEIKQVKYIVGLIGTLLISINSLHINNSILIDSSFDMIA